MTCLACRSRGRIQKHAMIPGCKLLGDRARDGWHEERDSGGNVNLITPRGEVYGDI